MRRRKAHAQPIVAPEHARQLLDRAVTEEDWMRQVTDYLEMHGWYCQHETDSRWSEPGLLDLICLRPPRLVWIECKTETGRLTREQQRWINELIACRQEVHVFRPSDWDRVVALLE